VCDVVAAIGVCEVVASVGVCVSWWELLLLGHLLSQNAHCEIPFVCFLIFVSCWVPYAF
jgi:hypothetical protein